MLLELRIKHPGNCDGEGLCPNIIDSINSWTKYPDRIKARTSSAKKIAIVGSVAKTSRQGGGSSQVDPLSVDNAYDAIVSRAGSGASVSYAGEKE